MREYDLAALVPPIAWKRQRVNALPLPVVEATLGNERDYLLMLRRMLRTILYSVRSDILPLVRRELATRTQITDAVDLSWFDRIEQQMGSLRRSMFGLQGRARTIIWHQIEKHTGHFIAAVRRVFRVDVGVFVREDDMNQYAQDALTRQESEVRGLQDDLLNRIRRATTNAVLEGKTVEQLAAMLKREFELTDQRAKILARDQVGNVVAELTEQRQRQAGISEYMWETSKDERVRPRHARLQGKIYKWGEATGAEQGLPPGKPVMCRCRAKAIVRLKRR